MTKQKQPKGMFTDVNIHASYAEHQMMKDKFPDLKCHFGKYQFIFSSPKGKISMIELKDYLHDGQDFFEILCIEGKLFQHEERHDTFQEAKKRAMELLT